MTPDECLRLPGISKDGGGQTIPGDMLIFTAGNSPIYGRQILYFLDPVFSSRARVKAPGVTAGFSRGLSDSLYFPMPFGGPQPTKIVDSDASSAVKPDAGTPAGDIIDEHGYALDSTIF